MNVCLPLRKQGEYRKLQDHVEEEFLGFNASLSSRTPLMDLDIGSHGMVHPQFDPIMAVAGMYSDCLHM